MDRDLKLNDLGLLTIFCCKRERIWTVYFSKTGTIMSVEAPSLDDALDLMVARCLEPEVAA